MKNRLSATLDREPELCVAFVQSLLALLLAFGVELTSEQVAAIVTVTAAGLAILTRRRARRG